MSRRNTLHSGRRKRRRRAPLPEPKRGAVYVRSARCAGNVASTLRDSPQYTRRANRRARQAGFDNAVQHAAHLLRLYEHARRFMGNRR